MSIRLGGWKRGDERLARVGVQWYLDEDDLAGLLVAATYPRSEGDLRDMPVPEIEQEIRTQLAVNAGARNWWRDEYPDTFTDPGEVTQSQAEQWALAQVRKLEV